MPGGPIVFADTGVLVCAHDGSDPAEPAKTRARPGHPRQRRVGRLGMRMLSEHGLTVVREPRPGLAPGKAWAEARRLQPRPVGLECVEPACRRQAGFGRLVPGEDMPRGRRADVVRLSDPFSAAPLDARR